MSFITLAILLLSLVFGEIFCVTSGMKKKAYLWWYIPWIAVLYIVAVFVAYQRFDLPNTFLLRWLYDDYMIEAFYSLICMMIWFPLQLLLRSPKVHEPLLSLYRKLFAAAEEKNTKQPFPYYYSSESKTVKSRVGRVFYRLTLKISIIIIVAVYAIALVVAHFYPDIFFPISAFGMLTLIPMIEYFLYLSTEAEEEQDADTEKVESSRANSNLDFLWQLFVDNYDNYSVAWKRDFDLDGKKRASYRDNNNAMFKALFDSFKDKHQGGIIEDCDLLTAFSELVPFFLHVIKEGRFILVAFDIPNHFSSTRQNSYLENIAKQLETVLVNRFMKINEIIKFKVYNAKATLDVFDNSIVMAPLSVLGRQDMKDKEWMSNLGLITVVNVFDKSVSNLYENRRFCHLLKGVNKDYQILVISALRKDLEASLEQTWVTTQEKHFPDGSHIEPYPRSHSQYFIGYNFEEYKERFNKVLKAQPNDNLYSGSEMLVFPLTSRVEQEEKVVTPVHQFDLAYTNVLEGNEEISRFLKYFKDRYMLSANDFINKVHAHVLPIDEIVDSQAFSVIYDNENNAVSAYRKWMHVGNSENFSIVISKPYLFRDYFNANHHFFSQAPFSALQPCLCKSRLTLAIILLDMLKDSDQDENAIKSHLTKYYYKPEEIVSVPDKLKELFSTCFGDDLANDLRTNQEIVFDGSSYQSQIKFRLVHPDRVCLPYLDIITVQDENGNVLFDILHDLLFQNYSKGQHHSFSGLPYTIGDFDQVNKILYVRRSKELSNGLFYKPCYHVDVEFNDRTQPINDLNMKEPDKLYNEEGIEKSCYIEAFETNIEIKPQSWVYFEKRYEAPKYSVGASRITSVNHDITPNRRYATGKILKFSMKYLPSYGKRIDDIRKMLQILIYEGLQSLFPHQSQYLIVASSGDGDSNLPWIFPEFNSNDEKQSGWLSFYFIEDAHIDLGLIGSLSYDNIKYLMRYVFDYLLWLTEESNFPDGYIEYRNRSNYDKLTFLKYGNSELPLYFDLDLAINFIKDQFKTKGDNLFQMQIDRQANNSIMGCCDFCRTMMKNCDMQRLDDGRMRCPDCSKDAIDTEEQFQQLCNEVKKAFQTHLDIDLSRITFHAKLVSAVVLHKKSGHVFSVTNGYDVRKFIGLACDRDVDSIYVENGYKPNETYGIIAHEMTHIWEYNDADFQKIRKTNEDWVEGLAVWTDLFLSEKNGMDVEGLRRGWLMRDDEYGRGLRLIMNTCPDDPYGYIRKMAQTI